MAVAISDVHLCEKPPLFRSNEKDWLKTQAGYLAQVSSLATIHKCPIILAGDLFDKWNPSPRLINFALTHLPVMYAVFGQHDMRNHCLSDLDHTAYWTLVKSGRVVNLDSQFPTGIGPITLHAFPWDFPLKPCQRKKEDLSLHIAVVHKYVWMKECGYTNAPEENRVKSILKQLSGYDVVVTGDNHIGFLYEGEKGTLLNCGGFMRRRSDERDYKPSVGLIQMNGKVTRHYLDISQDQCLSESEMVNKVEDAPDFSHLLSELQELGDSSLDFRESVKHILDSNKVSESVRKQVMKAMEDE